MGSDVTMCRFLAEGTCDLCLLPYKWVSTAFPNSKTRQFLRWRGGKDKPSGGRRKKVASRLLTMEDEDYLRW